MATEADRNLVVLKVLADYLLMTREQLARALGRRSMKGVERQTGRLVDAGLVVTTRPVGGRGMGRPSELLSLSEKGWAEVVASGACMGWIGSG